MDAGINNVNYMELHLGPKMANGTCGKMIVAGKIDRGSTVNTFIPLTLEVCIYPSLTSSAGQTAWHLPHKHHTPTYLESAAGGTDDPNPTSTEPCYM